MYCIIKTNGQYAWEGIVPYSIDVTHIKFCYCHVRQGRKSNNCLKIIIALASLSFVWMANKILCKSLICRTRIEGCKYIPIFLAGALHSNLHLSWYFVPSGQSSLAYIMSGTPQSTLVHRTC